LGEAEAAEGATTVLGTRLGQGCIVDPGGVGIHHALDITEGLRPPAVDLPVGPVLNHLREGGLVLEQADAANDCPGDWVAVLPGSRAVPSELGLEVPLLRPRLTELRGRLLVDHEDGVVEDTQHVKAADVHQGIAGVWVVNGEWDGEGELDCGSTFLHQRLDRVVREPMVAEIVVERPDHPGEGLRCIVPEGGVPPGNDELLQPLGEGLGLGEAVLVKAPPGDLDCGGETAPRMEVDGRLRRRKVVDELALPLQRAGDEGLPLGVVNEVGE